MVRGLRKPWKYPLFYDFDLNMTLDIMCEVITVIEGCGGLVRSCTGDMGNKTFLAEVGVARGIYSFQNPVRPESKVHVLCDAPHLIKLMRNHTLDSGIQYKSEEGVITNLNIKDYENLKENDSSEGEPAKHYKLGEDHLYCTGPTRQRVRLAVQFFSRSIANGFKMLGEFVKAWIVKIINDWFDVMDSRLKYHKSNQNKCGLGTHEEIQLESLNAMINLIQNIKFAGASKPFMKGILCTTKSTINLYNELKEECLLDYLCTYQLNQDPLELFFAQVRSLGGSNNHPRSADFCSRFRTLSMCSNSMVDNILSPNTNVTPDTESSEHSWNALSVVADCEDFSDDYYDAGLLNKTEEDELQFELPGRTDPDAVQYITGYIARQVCFDQIVSLNFWFYIPFSFQLSLPTRMPEEGSFTYLQSRIGGLVRASDEVEDQIQRVNEAFNLLHGKGNKLKMGENMIERTVKFILRRNSCKDIDIKIVRLFVKVKFFYRLKCINLKVKYSSRNKKNKSLRDAVKISHQMY